jgi:hypothetical protein
MIFGRVAAPSGEYFLKIFFAMGKIGIDLFIVAEIQ